MSESGRLNGTFGFDPADGHHHFLVVIPAGDSAERPVTVHECQRFAEGAASELPVGALERVQFPFAAWKAISEQVRAAFNLRLKQARRKPGKWRSGPNYLAPHYGKELVLLGWALEDVPIDRADTVFRNWRGLAPEERWWLYGTANAPFSQNSRKGRGIGWRKALTVALSENPLADVAGESGRQAVVIVPSVSPTEAAATSSINETHPPPQIAKKKRKHRPRTSHESSAASLQPSLFNL